MSEIDRLLAVDPLAEAERITGVSYKDKEHGEGFDNPATALGLILMQTNAVAKDKVLRETGDTVFSNELPRYQTIIEKYGFEKVLEDHWQSTWGPEEIYFIYAHRKGLLLAFDTFDGKRVNGGKVYYNWRPASLDVMCGATSSGGMTKDGVWVGDHDCREALIHNLTKLDNRGEFVCPWAKRGFLWLLHFDDPKTPGYNYQAITSERVSRLPQWVRDFIGPEKNG